MGEQWKEIRQELLDEMDMSRDLSDEELHEHIYREISRYSRQHLLSLEGREDFERHIFNSFRKLDVIQDLLDDDGITEIMVNAPDRIFYEKEGALHRWRGGSLSEEKLSDVIQQIVGSANRTVNEARPIVDARLPDGSRVNVVMPPVAVDGAVVSIRKFSAQPLTLGRLIGMGSISAEAATFLTLMVRAGYNIFVSGGTGSGKTTFLNALSEYIPKDQRVVTIEDSAELQMKSIPNLVRLETRMGNGSGSTDITIRDLIRTALRMRPDRIIVGEVRGAEALDMLQSFNTGHDGSLSTGHANSSGDMLSRLETMVLMAMDLPMEAIRRQIASGIDILVHLGRLRDKSRKVMEISELAGIKDGRIELSQLYVFRETGEKDGKVCGVWERGESLKNIGKLQTEGLFGEYEDFLSGKQDE